MVAHNFSWKWDMERSIKKYKYRIKQHEKQGNGKATMSEKQILKELEERYRNLGQS